MMNFYRNKPILFAVLWIVFYVVTAGTLRSGGDDSPYMTIGLIVIAGVLLLFIHKNGLAQELGLTSWPNNAKQMLYFVPVWLITTGNLWTGIDPHYQGLNLVCAIVSMALVGVVEELVFRGLLFRGMLKEGSATSAIVVSALTFGIGHIVNLLNGQDTLETLVQIVFAVAIGLMFTLVYYKGGSLLPVIVAHSLIDVASIFSGRSATALFDAIATAAIIVIAIAYSVYLWRLDTPQEAVG